MKKSLLVTAATGGGKSTWIYGFILALMKSDVFVAVLDIQRYASAFNVWRLGLEAGFDLVMNDLDADKVVLKIPFLESTDNPKTEARHISAFKSAIGAYRGDKNMYQSPMLSYYIGWWAKLVMNQVPRKPLAYCLKGLNRPSREWRELVNDCQCPETAQFWLNITKTKTEVGPAIRALSVFDGPTVQAYETNENRLQQVVENHNGLLLQGGQRVTVEEQYLLIHSLVNALIELKLSGLVDREIVIVIEESQLVGVSNFAVQHVLQTGRKLGIFLILVAQNPSWPTAGVELETVMNNCDLWVGKQDSFGVALKLAKELGIDATDTIKHIDWSLRERTIGYTSVDYETETESLHDSVTTGSRIMPIKGFHWEGRPKTYTPTEGEIKVAQGMMRMYAGEALVRSEGRTRFIRFPELATDISKEDGIKLFEEQDEWNSSTTYDSSTTTTPEPSTAASSTSETNSADTSTQERKSRSSQSGYWSQVDPADLLAYLTGNE